MTTPAPLRIMVVDDTITYRMIMKSVAESVAGIVVVSSVNHGRAALDRLGQDQPEVVLLDVEMPVLDGLETLKHLRAHHPEIAVVMVSGLSRSNANLVMECLQAGALDFVTKPLEANATRAREALRRDLEPILTLLLQKRELQAKRATARAPTPVAPSTTPAAATTTTPAPAAAATPRPLPPRAPVPARPVSATPPPPPPSPTPASGGATVAATPAPAPRPPASPAPRPVPRRTTPPRPNMLLIGSSTGGPAALTRLLASLGRPLTIPTLIVQHMPPVFTASLAVQLARTSGLDVREAQEGLPVEPGRVILAMGGVHMVVKNQGQHFDIALDDGPKVNECRPAVDVLFQSVAEQAKGEFLAVILTGMGRDGTQGVEQLKARHPTWCIAQDKESCVVYGMPRAVEEGGLADEVLPLDKIGPRILELCR
ncbi:MAG: chemotaxis-specific protein-glutamate methyltransferase CheB [Magnetococcales bacterium]|nr:chemotaxis-specific protein-glutamate methyltransferase CheB [Magnetococcales bacterium]